MRMLLVAANTSQPLYTTGQVGFEEEGPAAISVDKATGGELKGKSLSSVKSVRDWSMLPEGLALPAYKLRLMLPPLPEEVEEKKGSGAECMRSLLLRLGRKFQALG